MFDIRKFSINTQAEINEIVVLLEMKAKEKYVRPIQIRVKILPRQLKR